MNKKKVAVLISGYGGNLQALIDACEQKDFPAKIVTVISNNPEAYGLERARKHGIPAVIVNHRSFDSRRRFDEELHTKLIECGAEIVCLAGFMRLLTEDFVNKWEGKMINIHPSLLPEFKGGKAVEDALKAGAKRTGCTVHYVIPEMDSGEIILQRAIDIAPNDTLESLKERIHKEEHIAYPEALKKICE